MQLSRRKNGTTMTPTHRGLSASGQASCSLIQSAAVSTCCQFRFTERGTCAGSQCRWAPAGGCQVPRHREAGRREDGTSRPPHAAEGSSQARALEIAHGPEVLAALAEPDAPHSRKAAAAAERHDLALMQPLLPEPAFLLSTPWLLQCWTFIVQRMYFLSCAQSDFCSLPACAAFRSAHGKLEFSTTPFAPGPEVLTALAEPYAPHSQKAAAAAERHDLTLMQPLHSGSAFTLSSATLVVLDLHCEPKWKFQMRNAACTRVCCRSLWSSPRLSGFILAFAEK